MTKAVTSTEGVEYDHNRYVYGRRDYRLMVTMATGNELIIPRRGSSMHRLHRRASVSFSHPSIFITKGIATRRQPSVKLS